MTSVARLADRVAIVTGAGQGLGRAIALRYAAEAAQVAVVDTNEATAEKVAGEIAGAYAFLASEDANYITGQVLPVDGGLVMVR
ncbi:hypothetical protein A5780_27250 [Nocardia sp. 852002-20019_SCH5090214]|uniref:SDR family oxidoreductase n=1 Tax=Nocardia sp. 852002-20019_SCH5090214 TaxID=1834087 RepID=UPI0007EBECA7|nr:SDR family oxidoreductase [Nocardia sp. 852002-20019_SCH5090214]OBA53036.1 hypothetical protein A5780_27250 [Nocardia sp. 852002-20019_SCH5090214]